MIGVAQSPSTVLSKREKDRNYYLANAEKIRERARASYAADPARARERIAKWQAANPDKIRGYRNKRMSVNPEAERERLRLYALAHPDRVRETKRRWKAANTHKRDDWKKSHDPIQVKAYERAAVALRRARLLQATPVWLTSEEKRLIRALHAEAERLTLERGAPYHVDHILPLRGRRVCGLHLLANMRVISAHENCIKSNLEIGEINAPSFL